LKAFLSQKAFLFLLRIIIKLQRMVRPPSLKAGDKVGITAPGRKISIEEVKTAVNIMQSWKVEVVHSPKLFSNAHGYLAGTDAERLNDLQQFVDHPEIKAIICARGGYGTTRILDKIDFSSLLKNPKWIVGFSDVTAMHLRLAKLGINSVHGTMPILFGHPDSRPSVESLWSTLKGNQPQISAPPDNNNNKHGQATGQVIGGNLSLIADAIGTPTDPDTEGKILVLEEIDEYTYKIDRMLMHLKRSGKLDRLAGLVIGHMTDIKEPELPFGQSIKEIVLEKISSHQFPVAFNFPIGHENPNLAWVHGALMTLSVTENGSQLTSTN
jgi:muramoyltetrapeptide carboxypeptidase